MMKRWNCTIFSSMSSGSRWASIVFTWKLTECRRFQFWYQPREALNAGSVENSFAFRHSINPLTAKPIKINKKPCKWIKFKRFESLFTLSWQALLICYDEVQIWPIGSVNSHALKNKLVCVYDRERVCSLSILHSALLFKQFQYRSVSNIFSPWSLCSVNHSNICWSTSRYFGVKRPIVVCFANIFSSLLKSLAWSLCQRWTVDSLSPY